MKSLLAIAGIAGAIRVATALDPSLTAVVVGGLVLAAAGYGLFANGRSHWLRWRLAWGLLGLGLAGNVATAVVDGFRTTAMAPTAGLPLSLRLAADAVTIAGLVVVLHQRVPGRGVESLIASTVVAGVVAFPMMAFVMLPDLGWHPARELAAIAPAFFALVMLVLGSSVVSISRPNPAAYRYLLGGLACVFVAQSTAAAVYLGGGSASPVPLDTIVLWGCCLWGWAMVHRSQRRSLAPVPLHSTRPGRLAVGLMVVGALVGPGVLVGAMELGHHADRAFLDTGAAALPILVVLYLLHQVFARSAAEYQAQHDPLTGVCNPVLFNDRLEAALAESRRTGRGLALMFLDLDRFKSINDSLGHAVGNHLLQAVVQRLQRRIRPKDTLARMGGDEFVLLLPEVDSKEHGANLAERMLDVFVEPFHVDGKLLAVQASVGIAVHPDDGDDTDTLFKNADIAMYRAKAAGRNTFAVFDSAMSSKAELHYALESSLRSAVDRGRLTMHYQPKVTTLTGGMIGVEALARWEHPRLGFIPPSTFIPLAEESSLISSLGESMLETACLQAKDWQAKGVERLSIAVNVSPRQFARRSVVQMVSEVLERTKLDPSVLELEVAESVLVEHMEETAQSLLELRKMGVRCSIDDFGTGYSALTYLTDISVDAIKIDPSFIRRIDAQPGAAPIVGAVIDLAHSLGLTVVAEGVETPAQLEFLAARGCDQVQGYLFSRPVPAEEIDRLLADSHGLLVAHTDALDVVQNPSLVLPPERLAEVLAAIQAPNGSKEPSKEDLLAVLAALEPEELLALTGVSSHALAARIALGTLAGLVTVTAGLGATGTLPQSARQLTSDLLKQTLGISLPPPHVIAPKSFRAPNPAPSSPHPGVPQSTTSDTRQPRRPPTNGSTPSASDNARATHTSMPSTNGASRATTSTTTTIPPTASAPNSQPAPTTVPSTQGGTTTGTSGGQRTSTGGSAPTAGGVQSKATSSASGASTPSSTGTGTGTTTGTGKSTTSKGHKKTGSHTTGGKSTASGSKATGTGTTTGTGKSTASTGHTKTTVTASGGGTVAGSSGDGKRTTTSHAGSGGTSTVPNGHTDTSGHSNTGGKTTSAPTGTTSGTSGQPGSGKLSTDPSKSGTAAAHGNGSGKSTSTSSSAHGHTTAGTNSTGQATGTSSHKHGSTRSTTTQVESNI